jgi:hypothetical protein
MTPSAVPVLGQQRHKQIVPHFHFLLLTFSELFFCYPSVYSFFHFVPVATQEPALSGPLVSAPFDPVTTHVTNIETPTNTIRILTCIPSNNLFLCYHYNTPMNVSGNNAPITAVPALLCTPTNTCIDGIFSVLYSTYFGLYFDTVPPSLLLLPLLWCFCLLCAASILLCILLSLPSCCFHCFHTPNAYITVSINYPID